MISVILPTYNRDYCIAKSIESVLRQTYVNIELIIVDDGSQDNTEQVINQIDDARIKYYKREKMGACSARNYGISVSRGEYIAFQDSDDIWNTDKLEKELTWLINNHADVVCCAFERHNLDRENEIERIPNSAHTTGRILFRDLIPNNFCTTSTLLLKKECLAQDLFDVTLERFQDWELMLRLTQKWNVFFLNEVLVQSYIQQNSISNNGVVPYCLALEKIFHMLAEKYIIIDKENEILDLKTNNSEKIELIEQQVKEIKQLAKNMEYIWINHPSYWLARKNINRNYLSSEKIIDQISQVGIKNVFESFELKLMKKMYLFFKGTKSQNLRRILKKQKNIVLKMLPPKLKIKSEEFILNVSSEMTKHQSRENTKDSFFPFYDTVVNVKKPLISIIVPNFNHEEYLIERLESIYNQTYQNFEVILLDDCSSDNSREILLKYERLYPDKTKTLFNSSNVGQVNFQWKKGIEAAKGDLIWIAESDDFCDLDFLEKLVPAFERESVQIAFARSVFIKNKEQCWTLEEYLYDLSELKWSVPFYETSYNLMKKGFAIKNIIPNVSSCIFRNRRHINCEVLEKWKNLKLCGDWIFYADIIRGGVVYYTNETTNFYRIHDKSTSLDVQKTEKYYIETEIVLKFIASHYELDSSVFITARETLLQHYKDHYGEKADIAHFDNLFSLSRIRQAASKRFPNVLICDYAFSLGGGEILPIYLAYALHKMGVPVTFLNCNYQSTVDRIRTKLPPEVPVINLKEKICVSNIVKDFGIEIVHTHHASVDKLIAQYAISTVKDRTLKHFITLHGMYETIEDPVELSSLLKAVDKTCTKYIYIADKNLSVFKKNGYYNEIKFIKLDNGMPRINTLPFPRDRLGIPEDAFVFCLVSRALFEKGWMEAIDIVEKANQMSKREIHLVLVGDGVAYQKICSLGYSKYIHLVGMQSNTTQFFLMSDMGFLPSRYLGESFPLVIIESLLCGKPVLASDIGEIRNMLTVNEKLAGKLINLRNMKIPIDEVVSDMLELVSNTSKYQELQDLAMEAGKRYDIEKVAPKYLNVYCS